MTYADAWNLRTVNVKSNDIADAIDGVLTRHWCGTTTGSANTYACTTSPSFSAMTTGQPFAVLIHATNTGSSTLAINGISPPWTIRFLGNNLVGGELVANMIHVMYFDGTYLQLVNHGYGWATWTPTLTASHGTWTGSASLAKYQRFGKRVDFMILASGTTNNASVTELRFTLPVTASSTTNARGGGSIFDGAATYAAYWALNSTTVGIASNYNTSTLGSGAGRQINVSGSYETA